jgi:hypothetical protein
MRPAFRLQLGPLMTSWRRPPAGIARQVGLVVRSGPGSICIRMTGLLLANDRTGHRLAMMTLRCRGEPTDVATIRAEPGIARMVFRISVLPFTPWLAQRGPDICLPLCALFRVACDAVPLIAPIAA